MNLDKLTHTKPCADDQTLNELIKKANGGLKGNTPRTLRTFWSKRPLFYQACEQYHALTQLGETRRKEALDYLNNIYTPKVGIESITATTVFKSYTIIDTDTFESYSYPNAHFNLAKDLQYKVYLITSNCGQRCERDKREIERDRINIPLGIKIHQIIRESMSNLKRDLREDQEVEPIW